MAGVDKHDRVGVDASGDLLEHQVDGLQQIGAHDRAVGARFSLVGVERRLERRVVRQRLGLRAELPLTSRFDGRKQPLRRFEVQRDRLSNLVPHAERDDDEHHAEEDSDGDERHRQCLHEQPGWTPVDHGATPPTGTGTVNSIDAALPASTRTRSARSPTRSCQPTIV